MLFYVSRVGIIRKIATVNASCIRFGGDELPVTGWRERVVKFIKSGGSKVEAARRFELGRSTVYRSLDAVQGGGAGPKTRWGHWCKLDPHKFRVDVKQHPDATLKELQTTYGVSHHAIWVRLGQLGFTLKKLIKYRERNEVQRWLFRRELEKLDMMHWMIGEC